jgi:hypothetical protein
MRPPATRASVALLSLRNDAERRLPFRKQRGKGGGKFISGRMTARSGNLGGEVGDNDCAQSSVSHRHLR